MAGYFPNIPFQQEINILNLNLRAKCLLHYDNVAIMIVGYSFHQAYKYREKMLFFQKIAIYKKNTHLYRSWILDWEEII